MSWQVSIYFCSESIKSVFDRSVIQSLWITWLVVNKKELTPANSFSLLSGISVVTILWTDDTPWRSKSFHSCFWNFKVRFKIQDLIIWPFLYNGGKFVIVSFFLVDWAFTSLAGWDDSYYRVPIVFVKNHFCKLHA